MRPESEPDTLSVPEDSERIAVILPQPISTGPCRESVLNPRCPMPDNIKQFRCGYVSATEAGDGFQVLFETVPDSDEGMCLFRGTSSFPMGVLATWKPTTESSAGISGYTVRAFPGTSSS